MKGDLISRSALLEQMHNHYEVRNPKQNATMDECCMMVIHAPTIEAEPVRNGRWVDRYGGKYANPLYECSECKEKALYKYEVDVLDNGHFVQALSNACPHCRAKMDGGGGE